MFAHLDGKNSIVVHEAKNQRSIENDLESPRLFVQTGSRKHMLIGLRKEIRSLPCVILNGKQKKKAEEAEKVEGNPHQNEVQFHCFPDLHASFNV